MRLGGLIFTAIVAVAIAALVLAIASKRKPISAKVKRRALLTANELEFLNRLEAAVPEIRFHAQVAMGALLEPAFPKKLDRRAYMSIRGTFSQKVVDFVAQDRRSGDVVAVIELDDRTHDASKDGRRDAMLREGAYKDVRWQSTAKPDAAAIRQSLLASSQDNTRALHVEVTAPVNSTSFSN